MDTVYLDTNAIRNQEANRFFGQSEKYRRLSEVARIVIPEMVINEICLQKEKYLKEQLRKFSGNYFCKMFDYKAPKEIERFIPNRISILKDSAANEFNFELARFNHDSQLEQIIEFAQYNRAPFEKGTDKGFKDMIIYLTILQHMQSNEVRDTFVITNDGRLAEALNYEGVTVVKDIDAYFNSRKSYFIEDYFIGQLNEYFFREDLLADHVKKVHLNEDLNWEIDVFVDRQNVKVLVDYVSREIIGEPDEEEE